MPSDDAWLSSEAAAEMLGVSRPTLYKRINDGLIPAYRMGRLVRLRRSDVEEYLRVGGVDAAPDVRPLG